MLGVPLIADGQLLGVMHIGTLEHRTFNEDDVGTPSGRHLDRPPGP